MDWMKFAFIVVLAGTVTTITDWLFTGGLMQKYFSYPEIWREKHGGLAGILAGILPFFTCAAFAFTANHLAVSTVHAAVKLAVAMWAIGPLTMILTNAAYIRMHKVFVLSYAVAWLVKLLFIAVLVGHFLR